MLHHNIPPEKLRAGLKIQCLGAEEYWLRNNCLTIGKAYILKTGTDLRNYLWIEDDSGTPRNNILWNSSIQSKFRIVQSCDSEEIE